MNKHDENKNEQEHDRLLVNTIDGGHTFIHPKKSLTIHSSRSTFPVLETLHSSSMNSAASRDGFSSVIALPSLMKSSTFRYPFCLKSNRSHTLRTSASSSGFSSGV